MLRKISAFILVLTSFTALSQISIEFEKINGASPKDGIVKAKVSGGEEPYHYYWSDKGTGDTSVAVKLVEGSDYTLRVTDANGATAEATVNIQPEQVDERINSVFVPVVDAIGGVFMVDPFAKLGMYDPVLKNDDGEVLTHPNGDPQTMKIPLIVIWLVLGALFFTIRFKLINFRGLGHAIGLVKGNYDNPKDEGEVSHFQALTTALSGTVGLGNIAGVAVAMSVGGAGATFWMIVAGLLGTASKFAECTLGVKYREMDESGTVYGGPMYYLSKGLAKRNMAVLGKVLAFMFAILCIGGSFGGGNMFQSNQAFEQLSQAIPALDGQGALFGVIMAVLVGAVIIGGIKSIAKVTDKIVPLMVGVYVTFALIIIGMNLGNIGSAFSAIFSGAFDPDAALGGIIGVLIVGFQRAAFSNEAGVGSASIAHSAVKTNEPVSEGVVALMEPLVDTVVVCTMTALVLIFTGYVDDPQGLQGAQLTSAAFGSSFPWFSYVLTFAIVLFAFSTMISWSYYGLNAVEYLFGKSKWVNYGYKLLFCCFVVVGSSSSLGAVIDFSDLMVLGMAFPNVLGLIILSGEVRKDLQDYMGRVKSGAIRKFKGRGATVSVDS